MIVAWMSLMGTQVQARAGSCARSHVFETPLVGFKSQCCASSPWCTHAHTCPAGNYEAAIESCFKAHRLADALLIANIFNRCACAVVVCVCVGGSCVWQR